MFATIVCGEVLYLKSYLRPRVGFQKSATRNWSRIVTKLLSLNVTLSVVFLIYAMAPFYQGKDYADFLIVLKNVFPAVFAFANLYVLLLDHRIGSPDDGLLHFGYLLRGHWKAADNQKIIDYGRSVLLRGYFIAPMLAYFIVTVGIVFMEPAKYTLTTSGKYFEAPVIDLIGLWMLAYFFLAGIDVLFAVIGYMGSFKILDAEVRSTEPTIFGWLICLCCYAPLFEVVMIPFVLHHFFANPDWYVWLSGNPYIFIPWIFLTIVSMGAESLSTMTFGIRFSNLTYRGLISTGLFRYTKHPQYISKMFNRLFIHVPFFSLAGPKGVAYSLVLYGVIGAIYYFRARTEENHLSRYDDYAAYAEAMNGRSVFRFTAKLLPFLRYSREKALAGKLF